MTNDTPRFVSRRTSIKAGGLAIGTLTLGGAGLFLSTRRAAAALSSNALSGDPVSISGDGGEVMGFELDSNTTIDLSWEGFDADVNSVTFTLKAKRTKVGTGTDEQAARGALADDAGTDWVTLFTDTVAVITPGRSGDDTYASTDLTTSFPFAIISGGSPGPDVVDPLTNGNIDATSLSLDTDGDVKVNVVTFTLSADLTSTASGQTLSISETGTMDFVVENLAAAVDTGATLSGTGSAQ